MAKKRKPSAIKQAYAKEQRRIKQFINRASKRGYLIPENILPKTPKRITRRSVETLKKITPESIYKKSEYVDTSTGEIIKGIRGREYERSQAAKKAAQTRKAKKQAEEEFWSSTDPFLPEATANMLRGRNIIDEIRQRLTDIRDSAKQVYQTSSGNFRRRRAEVVKAVIEACNTLLALLIRVENAEGFEAVGQRLNPKAEEINYYIDRIGFASKAVDVYNAMSALIPIIANGSLIADEQKAVEILDEYEDGLDDV